VTSWMALGSRVLLGGVRYRATRMKNAATPLSMLEKSLRKRAARAGDRTTDYRDPRQIGPFD
jgi:hypothetical protein